MVYCATEEDVAMLTEKTNRDFGEEVASGFCGTLAMKLKVR